MEYMAYAGAAAAATAGAALYKGYEGLKVPRELKDMPEISTFALMASYVRGEPLDEAFDRILNPALKDLGYARIWMVNRWEVIVSNPKLIREILSRSDVFLKSTPGGDPSIQDLLISKFLGKSNILVTDGKEWLRHRKICNPAFKKQWPPEMFGQCGQELIEKLEEYKGAPVIVHTQFQRLTIDALGRGIFSYDFEAVKKGSESHYLSLYNEILTAAFNPMYFMIPKLESIVPTRKYYHKRNTEFRNFLAEIIEQRKQELENGVDSDDLLSLMIKASAEDKTGDGISDEEVLNNLTTFFLAGHDSTANTLTTTFYYVAKHQEIQQRAREEVLEVLGDNESLTVPNNEQLKLMPFINCIIKESMRIITTFPQFRRYCKEQTTLSGGQIIPANTYVVVNSWAVHHDPEIFPEPEKFDPERFLELHGTQDSNWIAFGSGSRKCLGISFSLSEQIIIMAMLLQKFTFKLGPKYRSLPKPKLNATGLAHPVDMDILFAARF